MRSPNPSDRRQFGRRDTFVHGAALVPGRPPEHCLLRDISTGGALLEFRDEVWLPFCFRLTVDTLKIDTHCEIRHQRENRIGVMFVGRQPHIEAVVDKLQSRLLDSDQWQGRGAKLPSVQQLPAAATETLRDRIFRRANTAQARR